jgi:hypothetical protein
MLLRNSLILAILSLQPFAYSLVSMLIMIAATRIALQRIGGRSGWHGGRTPSSNANLSQQMASH